MESKEGKAESGKLKGAPWQTGSLLFISLFSVVSSKGLTQWPSGKESTYKVGDTGWIPGSERSPGGGSGNPLQCSCLRNLRQRRLVSYSPWSHK